MGHELLFFPDYRAANPYQQLLYDHAGGWLHPRPAPVAEALQLLRQKGLDERVILHLHWEDAVYRNEPTSPRPGGGAGVPGRSGAFINAGGRLLWTLHNTAPHDARYLAVHEALVARLPALADIVHVHSRTGAGFAVGRLGVAPELVAVVPHGNYLPLHRPRGGPQAASRAALGLPEDGRRVLLLFGRLGAYKGGAELLDALDAAGPDGPHLLVAGKQVEPLGPRLDRLPNAVRARIVVRDGFVPEGEVETLFHAADAVVLPYRAILTSGTALLALSLARPVIAPALPSLAELLEDGRDALLYDPGDADGLAGALHRFAALAPGRLVEMQAAALATAAERHDWRQGGLLLDGLMHRLVAMRRPMRVPRSPTASGGAG
jgi:glycosyltransferase involved in cell wall biosynthesis